MFIRIVTWQSCLFVDLLNEKEESWRQLETEQAGKHEEHLRRSYQGRGCSVKRATLAEKREASGKSSLRIVCGESKLERREISAYQRKLIY
jgi:hypothetical protein